MKTTKSLTLAALLALSPAVLMGNASADEATATAVDLARVNANIQQVIDSSFQPTDVIEGVSFKLNPKNADLEKLKLQAVATATAKTSPWAPNEKNDRQSNNQIEDRSWHHCRHDKRDGRHPSGT